MRQPEFSAQRVGDAVADAQRHIAERQPRQIAAQLHGVAGLIAFRVRAGVGQVGQNKRRGLFREHVGNKVGAQRHQRLQRVGQGVHARLGRQAGGQRIGQFRLQDGHVGHQLGVAHPHLPVGVHVRDDHGAAGLAGRAAGGGDGDEISLFVQGRHMVVAALQLRKGLDLRVLVQHPHGLGGVQHRAAAQGDDHVRLPACHFRRAPPHTGEVRVPGHVFIHAALHARGRQVPGDGVRHPGAPEPAAADHDQRAGTVQPLQMPQGALAEHQLPAAELHRSHQFHVASPL